MPTPSPQAPSLAQIQAKLTNVQDQRLQEIKVALDNVTDAIKKKQINPPPPPPPSPAIKKSEIISWILIAVGWGVTALGWIYNAWMQRKMKVQENIVKAVSMFDGGTQKRSVGIVMLEAFRKDPDYDREQHDPIWAPVIVAQANHLMLKSKPEDAVYESDNFDKIIGLLKFPTASLRRGNLVRAALAQNQKAYEAAKEGKPVHGVFVSPENADIIANL